jgi:hypothetical protein
MLGRLQRLGPWLFSLFLIGQVGGVIPAISVDTVHELDHTDTVVVSMGVAAPDTHSRSARDHLGIHDEHDQCCAVHHGLIGMLPQSFDQVKPITVRSIFELAPTTLVSTSPSRLDRPPRA